MAYLFAKENYSIISGLAMGCDTYAHKGCLDANGMTVGVLSSGLDIIYPIQNRELAERIIENNGCLLSDYPIGFTMSIFVTEIAFSGNQDIIDASKICILVSGVLSSTLTCTTIFLKPYLNRRYIISHLPFGLGK